MCNGTNETGPGRGRRFIIETCYEGCNDGVGASMTRSSRRSRSAIGPEAALHRTGHPLANQLTRPDVHAGKTE